jgi:4-hydroxyphenylpyruvate dioxygenase-like putative hemolysin
MRKILLTTYRTPSEVHNVLEFLAELQTTIKVNYADELNEFYREIANQEKQEYFDFEDDVMPF